MIECTVPEVDWQLPAVSEVLVELVAPCVDAPGNGHGITSLQRTHLLFTERISKSDHIITTNHESRTTNHDRPPAAGPAHVGDRNEKRCRNAWTRRDLHTEQRGLAAEAHRTDPQRVRLLQDPFLKLTERKGFRIPG